MTDSPPGCPHTNWIAETTTDSSGMVTEHCANPLCNATRKVFGSWEALMSNKLIDYRPITHWTVFPRLSHDSVDDIMREIKSGGGMVLSGAISSQPDPINITPAAPVEHGQPPLKHTNFPLPRLDPSAEISTPAPLKKEGKPRKKSREKRPYGYMKKNVNDIIRDIVLIGPDQARVKWDVPESTWKSYINGRWKDRINQAELIPMQGGPAEGQHLTSTCPCSEIVELRAYREAVKDLLKIASGIQESIGDILKEVANGKRTGKNPKQGRNPGKLRKSPVEQG